VNIKASNSRLSSLRNEPLVVFSDLDGTLLNSKGEVSRRTQRAIHTCFGRGIIVVPVTARSSYSAAQVLTWLRAPVPVVCQNGAIYFSPVEGRVTKNFPIPSAILQGLLTRLRSQNIPAVLDLDIHKCFSSEAAGLMRRLPRGPSLSVPSPHAIAEPVYTVIIERTEEADSAVDSLSEDFPDLRLVRSSDFTIDITSIRASKVIAVTAICSDFRIEPDSSIAFGDGDNDIEMLSFVGVGIAMANASDRLRQVADVILSYSNDDEGVARFLETLMTENRG